MEELSPDLAPLRRYPLRQRDKVVNVAEDMGIGGRLQAGSEVGKRGVEGHIGEASICIIVDDR